MITAIEVGKSTLLIGEAGSGKTTLAETLLGVISGSYRVATANYSGSVAATLKSIAEQWRIDATDEKGKPLKGDALREEIASNVNGSYLLICDNVHRWAASLLYWLEILHERGAILVLLSIVEVKSGIFLKMSKIELSRLSEAQIREIMVRESVAIDFPLTPSSIARLQSIAGSNPMLAKQMVNEAKLGRHLNEGKGSEYLNVAPFVNGIFTALGIIRFVGLGLGDRALYIFGGIAMLIAMSLRYFGMGLNQAARRKPLGKK
jgi:energy-coupling factor transporter ATP-binding protein EcfA2